MASFTYINYKEDNTSIGQQYYVRLRDLLGFLQNGSSGISSIIPKIRNKGGEDSALKFDLDVENNLMWLDPFQVSTDPLKCVIYKNINFDGVNHTFGVSTMEPFEITKGNYTYGQILNIYINCVFIIDIIKTNTGDDGKIDLYTFLEKILEGINTSFSGLNNLTMFIDETTNEVKFVDQNPLPGRENLITNKQTTKFRMFGYEGGENSFVKDYDFKTEITPQLATMITVGAAANNTVVGADATAISYLNAGLTDRFKNSMYNDTSIDESVKKYETGWSVKIKENPYGAYGKADPVLNSDGFKKALEEEAKAETQVATLDKMWDQYKDFLKRISTSINNDDKAEDARSATKELIDENRSKLKDLLQYASNVSNVKNIAQIRQNLQEKQNATAYANRSMWQILKDNVTTFMIRTGHFQPDSKPNSNTTPIETGLGLQNSITNFSNFTGFIPFNLGLTIDGLSGIKINQKFTVDTDFLPTNYPNTVDFLIKNISHEISNNKWYTKLESYCISKGGSNNSSSETYNTSVGNVSTSGGKITTTGVLSDNIIKGKSGTLIFDPNGPNYPKRSLPVKSIILHFTNGSETSTAINTVDFVGRANGNPYSRPGETGGIHWAVDRSGNKAQGPTEDRVLVASDNFNNTGVGIEIVNTGGVELYAGRYKVIGYSNLFATQDVINLGFKYYGTSLYQEYTDTQIASLKSLIEDIANKHPEIKKGIPKYSGVKKNVWKDFWNLGGKKPTPGSNITVPNWPNNYNFCTKATGLYPHVGGGGDHSDVAPTPKMLKLLEDFGYTT